MSDPAEIRGRRLRWCDTHKQPAWDYADGSVQCMHDLIVESYNEHVLGPVLLADPAPVGLTEVRINIAGDALMTAWAIIANAWEGDWSQAPDEWRAAAERGGGEDFHPLLDALQEDDHD